MFALVFSGQGSQKDGMIQDIAGHTQGLVEEILAEAEKSIGIMAARACLAPNIENAPNYDVQCALLFAGLLHHKIVSQAGVVPDMVSGHSFGEYAALVVCGALDMGTAFEIVFRRGWITERAAIETDGKMAAIIGLDSETVEYICHEVSSEFSTIVVAANYNSLNQTVVSGEKLAVDTVCQIAKGKDARVIGLKVSGAFHSPLMNKAAKEMRIELEKIEFQSCRIPFYSSTTGQVVENPSDLKQILTDQLNQPTQWIKTVQSMMKAGATDFCEIGPGTALKGFCRKIQQICQTCGKKEGIPRTDNGLRYGIHCDECAGNLVSNCRQQSW